MISISSIVQFISEPFFDHDDESAFASLPYVEILNQSNKTDSLFADLVDNVGLALVLIILSSLFFSGFIFIRHQTFHAPSVLTRLIDHSRPNFYSSSCEEVVLLSCSSYSYSSIYCYYLPYIALAWRRLGFEPLVFLVGSEETFRRLPLFNLLKHELKIQYYFVASDRARSVATSQLVRLFGGFLSLRYSTNKDLFVVTADVDLLPITRHRFEISRNAGNIILIVNAFCCSGERFSYENDQDIEYYPISYIGMNHQLWKRIFSPSTNCDRSFKFSIEMIECILKEKFNRTIPKDVVKGTDQWDIDQKLLR